MDADADDDDDADDADDGELKTSGLRPSDERMRIMSHTVDGRNSATVGRFSDFQIFVFLSIFEFLDWDLGSGRVSNR